MLRIFVADLFTDSPEGLDRKFVLNYYSRMRFIYNLLPLLQNAGTTAPHFSRTLSVLAAGTEKPINKHDLGLENSFSGVNCANHSVIMNDFMTEAFASRAPSTTFAHSYPGYVNTGLTRELPWWARMAAKALTPVISPFSVSQEETGERQLFHATSGIYKPAQPVTGSSTASGVSLSKELTIAEGADGKAGSGAFYVNWNGDITPQKAFVREYRQEGYAKMIWEHTMAVFERVDKVNSAN